ncbi:MAG: hypothetical protein AMR96_06325 [Candidatus Adiutrix intracellularis]|jgi:hypothetical protein|nr:MAG: hypothetical protein AMR96_06325 [Candidatus Adiutrix intracellularis]MDR2826491.1 hypothetical protein [Candidatus Adiutrix intracellularis]
MAETVSEITVNYEEEGELLIEELDKIVLNRGAWISILFRYRELDRQSGKMKPPKATLRRYQKLKGVYKKRDAINLSDNMARILVTSLNQWLNEGLLGNGLAEDEKD